MPSSKGPTDNRRGAAKERLARAEAVAAYAARLRERIGESDADEGLPHWHHASGGTSANAAENDRDGVFVDRVAVLRLIEEEASDDPRPARPDPGKVRRA